MERLPVLERSASGIRSQQAGRLQELVDFIQTQVLLYCHVQVIIQLKHANKQKLHSNVNLRYCFMFRIEWSFAELFLC